MQKLLLSFLTILSLSISGLAMSQDDEEKVLGFVDSIKNLEAFDDAVIKDQVLVLWPNPNTQNFLDFEKISKTLCPQHKANNFLVIWYMDSSLYRAKKEFVSLKNVNCLEPQS